ncbi:MAG TPA: glycine oxidase ThiO [Pyrinomonadaceae bacterium]|nr:glycine oxidase ThiO [Pyrinomonadaceae bacterium]
MRHQEAAWGRGGLEAIVVGGGVIGLAVARALASRGMKRIALIERADVGAEASHAAAGMLAPQAEADCADTFFQLACASRDLYPAFAKELRAETGIDIELERTGTLYLAFTEKDEEEISERYLWQRDAGLAVERLSADEVRQLEPCISANVRGALRFPLDVQVENRRLLAALSASVEKLNVRLLRETLVESLVVESGQVEGVETSRGRIHAPVVVLAAGAWTSALASPDKSAPGLSIEPVRGQILCFDAGPRLIRHVIYSPRGYLVPRLDGRLLAGTTTERAGFEKRVTAEGLLAITTHALEIAPGVGSLPLLDSWSGLRPCSEDERPVMGASVDVRGLFYATGHYRNGILLAPLTGALLAEQITTGKTSPFISAFGPERFTLAGVN